MVATLEKEVLFLHEELGALKAKIENVEEDLAEIKSTNKQLLAFMYRMEGGKAWLFGLLTLSATVGSLISGIVGFVFKAH